MIDENIQYSSGETIEIFSITEKKGKKVQVGSPRLDYDYEVSCQTGHLIIESDSQTEFDYNDDTIIHDAVKVEESRSLYSIKRDYSDKEMQSEFFDAKGLIRKENKSKKVQVGFSRLDAGFDEECQSGCSVEHIGLQTGMDDVMIMRRKHRKEENALDFNDMVDEIIQFDTGETMEIFWKPEMKGKKLQVGIPKLDCVYEVSCQTGHLVIDSESQMYDGYIDNISLKPDINPMEEKLSTCLGQTEYSDKEMQSDFFGKPECIEKLTKSKKVQVGRPRLDRGLDVGCQSGYILYDIGFQTGIDEVMIMQRNQEREKNSLYFQTMIDEDVQYYTDESKAISNQKEMKGKKLQVGNPKLDVDYEVSCQTGHLVMESNTQTYFDYIDNPDIIPNVVKYEETSKTCLVKTEYLDKEIGSQCVSEGIFRPIAAKSKKVQVGYPKLESSMDLECQSGCLVDDIGLQTGIEDEMVMQRKQHKEEDALHFDDLIDENIQYYYGETIETLGKRETKGKKLQVGIPRLNYDYEVSCQTGHLVMESDSQTDFDYSDGTDIKPDFLEMEEELCTYSTKKPYSDKEIQSEFISEERLLMKSKKVQVGYPRLDNGLDVECQLGCLMKDEAMQTGIDDLMIIQKRQRKEEYLLISDDLVDEKIQYYTSKGIDISNKSVQKAKMLQVGITRLDYDSEASCQTGHLVMESDSQTDFDDIDNAEIMPEAVQVEETSSSYLVKRDYSDKEIQIQFESEEELPLITVKSKTIQVGFPRLGYGVDIECQSGYFLNNIAMQTEIDEVMIMQRKQRKENNPLTFDTMSDEEIQYCTKTYIKTSKEYEKIGKKLQVGNSRLHIDYEVSCQTGHLVMESDSQTDSDYMDNSENLPISNSVKVESKYFIEKEYLDKEMQFEIRDDGEFPTKTAKSKKIQFGFPRLERSCNAECQAGVLVDDSGIQTGINDAMLIQRKERKEDSLHFDQSTDENIQYYSGETIENLSRSDKKGKKLQVGSPRLNIDYEVSCQTGHLVMESDSQTDFDYIDNAEIMPKAMQVEETSSSYFIKRDYSDKEMQSDFISEEETLFWKEKSKKVQVGYPKLENGIDVQCQSGCLVDDIGLQTGIHEVMVIQTKQRKEEDALHSEGMIVQNVQYNSRDNITVPYAKEMKGKKLQVGSPRLNYDIEVSCQTDHLVTESNSQTDFYCNDSDDLIPNIAKVEEGQSTYSTKIEYSDKEMQSEFPIESTFIVCTEKSKKVQVGDPKLENGVDIECQFGCTVSDIEIQTGIDDVMVMQKKQRKEESLYFDDKIDETIQYNTKENTYIVICKDMVEKNIQVGIQRFNLDYEVSCQTEHLVIESDSQTDFDFIDEEDIIVDKVKKEETIILVPMRIEYSDNEMQSEFLSKGELAMKTEKSKKVQVGHPRFENSVDVECQSRCLMNDIETQTGIDAVIDMQSKQRKDKEAFLVDDTIDENVQYYAGEYIEILYKKEKKGKKVQVGSPRLDYDYEASCQTDNLVMGSDSQTELGHDYKDIIPHIMKSEKTNIVHPSKKIYLDKEMQSELLREEGLISKTEKSKNVQVGHRRVNNSLDVECQSEYMINDGLQTCMDDAIIKGLRVFKEEDSLIFDDMIDESTQYSIKQDMGVSNTRNKAGKKLQVGDPKLHDDVEVSCQTDLIVMYTDSQTDLNFKDEVDIIPDKLKMEETIVMQPEKKAYFDKEMQCEFISEEGLASKLEKSKKVQVGHPNLGTPVDGECQSRYMMNNIGMQTGIDEVMFMQRKQANDGEAVLIDDMIDENLQYNTRENIDTLSKTEKKGKNVQIGSSRLDYDYEVSCQTDHLVMESDSQTVMEYEYKDDITPEIGKIEKTAIVHRVKINYLDKEMQCELLSEKDLASKTEKSKKVQVGHPRVDNGLDVECQSEYLMNDELQTCMDDAIIKGLRVFKENDSLILDDQIDESTQYSIRQDIGVSDKKHMTGKKLQVGDPKMNDDVEVACQTDLIVMYTDSQTDLDYEDKIDIIPDRVKMEEAIVMESEKKAYLDNEIQCEFVSEGELINKREQVKKHHVEQSQLGHLVKEIGLQTEFDDLFIMQNKQRKENDHVMFDDMIDEIIFYDNKNMGMLHMKDKKAKKLQVGNPRLDPDFEVISQTDYVAKDDTGSQTMDLMNILTEPLNQDLYNKDQIDKEIQSEFILGESVNFMIYHSKLIQMGHPRLETTVDFECQYGYLMYDIGVQTNLDESIVGQEYYKFDNSLMNDELVDETIQYGSGTYVPKTSPKDCKGKKLQVGSPRLDMDFSVSCQAEILAHDSECQTDDIKEIISGYIKSHRRGKSFSDNEMQSDYVCDGNFIPGEMHKEKKVQVGHPRLNDIIDVECQSRYDMNDKQYQTQQCDYSELGFIHHQKEVQMEEQIVQSLSSEIDEASHRKKDKHALVYVGTASWDYDMTTYNLLTFDLQFGNVVKHKKIQKGNPFTSEGGDNRVSVSKIQPHRRSSISSDRSTQTLESTTSHSVSLEISPKLPKFENEAKLVLNYFNKQVDIKDQKYGMSDHKTSETSGKSTNNDDSKKLLVDKYVQYLKSSRRYVDYLTDFNNEGDVTSVPIGKSLKFDTQTIPTCITKDYINLFESIGVPCTDGDDNESIEISLAPKSIEDKSRKRIVPSVITKTETNSQMIDEEIMYEDYGKYIEEDKIINTNLDLERIASDSLEICLAPKVIPLKSKSGKKTLIAPKGVCEMMDEEIMYEYPDEFKRTSINNDFVRRSDLMVQQSSQESVEISLAPKFIDLKHAGREIYSRTPERLMGKNSYSYSVQCDSKMTSTAKVVEKFNFGTQIYPKPLYDGQTQTTISTINYGEAFNLKSLSSQFSVSNISSFPKNLANRNLQQTTKHREACLDISFEEDYIVECVKSRSVVTTKQEVLPKFSYDFVDKKEEPAKLFVTDKETHKSTLCNTKTQSWNENSFSEATCQTQLEFFFSDHDIKEIYKRMISSRQLKERGIQDSNDDNLFDILVERKGLPYIKNKFRLSFLCDKSTETGSTSMKPSQNSHSISVQTMNLTKLEKFHGANSDPDNAISVVSRFSNRPLHKNKRIQRGCSFFGLKNAETNTVESFGDHIEVTYTETILEESVITKRPIFKIDDHYDFSKSSSLTRRSTSSTSIPVSNQLNKDVQTMIYPSQIFLEEANCDQFLTMTKTFHVTAVYDHRSRRYLSLKEAIKNGILSVENNKYMISNTRSVPIEKALQDGHLIVKHET